jgi:hypothetical protein
MNNRKLAKCWVFYTLMFLMVTYVMAPEEMFNEAILRLTIGIPLLALIPSWLHVRITNDSVEE